MDFISKVRRLPPAPPPNDNPASIKGNLALEKKQLSVNILAWHIANFPDSRVFGHAELKDLRLVETHVWKNNMGENVELLEETISPVDARQHSLQGQTVCEVTVTEEMLNVHGTLAGGCSAHLIDIGTFSSLLTLSMVTGTDYTGVSTSLNITYHAPAKPGAELRMVSTSISTSGRVVAARAEVYDKRTSKLLVSAVHTIAPFQTAQTQNKPSRRDNSKARL
ncbi:HotDog domain-containing protein [Fomitopsis serialis]|uniref:HotDog domain-containing protein n=1 Tax=Fomitopsis serialis TaxID=139415 RepID=UPI002007EB58|nr:HotDog domain-containing protein [Neoantrodia serialis]KAH9927338.1 HotDog domain-containing protein [Neoantrodia serialis]